MLKLNSIEVRYSRVILVLKGISLEVPDGSIIAMLGGNGAGKTTTLKAISGLLKTEEGEVTNGEIEFNGERIHKMNPDGRRPLSGTPDRRREFDGWRGRDSIPQHDETGFGNGL
jgi:ABC-type branched-subunit amino acid transport system ATPase component